MEHNNLDNFDTNELKNPQRLNYFLPVTIVILSIIISVVIVNTNTGKSKINMSALGQTKVDFTPGAPENVKPVNAEDHILGNPSAPVKIVEFSDFECPFCKEFQSIMWDVMDTYGKEGEVAWVYRHLPVDSLHTKSRKEAAAAECAGEIGGNKAFWDYADRIFEITPSNDNLDLSLLPKIAKYIGIKDEDRFKECLESGRFDKHIEDDFRDAVASGANGTPYSIIIAPNGKTFSVSGAQTYSTVTSIVEIALKER